MAACPIPIAPRAARCAGIVTRLLGPTVMFLSLVVALLTSTNTARANGGCVRVLQRGPKAHVVALGAGCDLRSVARLLPQRDADSGDVLPTQAQLRSIYAFNQSAAEDGRIKVSAVRRGCVPGKAEDPTPEEREACPNGVVNYYGIASVGSEAPIFVPQTRAASLAERLTSLGKTTCGTIAGVRNAYGDTAVPDSIQESLHACEKQLGDNIAPVAVSSAPSVASPEPAVAASAPAVLENASRIRALEQERNALLAAASEQRTVSNVLVGILGAIAVGLALLNIFLRLRMRKASANASNSQELKRVVEQMKKEFKEKLATAVKSHGTQLRDQIAAMRAVEQEYEDAIEYNRSAMGRTYRQARCYNSCAREASG